MTENEIFAEWVVLELMGHRTLAGFLTEQEIAGRGFLRLEIPGKPGMTQFYGPASVYAITPTTKEMAERVAEKCRAAPVQRWELERPALATAGPVESFPGEDGPF